jgi:hypothetical protein
MVKVVRVSAMPIKTAFGRTMLDEGFAALVGDHPLSFESHAGGWWVMYGYGSWRILCSGPMRSVQFGRETFRRLTGTDPMPEDAS